MFLFGFLPLLLLIYLTVRGRANSVLLVFSSLFYAWGEPLWVLILLLSVLVGWIVGRRIEQYRGRRRASAVMALSVAFQILLLFHFKYTGFLLETVRSLTSIDIPFWDPGLPLADGMKCLDATSGQPAPAIRKSGFASDSQEWS
ncbi:hypothetical protein [Brevibacillus massiliensis]|uniref:hypothetical protein n=1 Tax=Brevibacillus massiliensis TaxID=1118054 RepID=UPI00164DF0E4|nr:hypothetical protein [Brevibacillus massiliensis]